MIKELVNKEHPVAIYNEVMREFIDNDIAVNCGQILMCDAGSATLYINYRRTEMLPGTITLMKAGDIVRGENATDDYAVTCLAYDDAIMREASFRLETVVNDYLLKGFATQDAWTGRLFHQTVSLMEPVITDMEPQAIRDIAVMQVRSFFLAAYYRLVQNNPELDIQGKRKDKLFSDFFALLIANYKRERSVAFYASKMNMTSRYLNQIVTHATGRSTKAVIDDYVMVQLRMALQVSDKTVTELAWDFNFESVPFFCDYFKNREGLTPQKYRESCLS